MPYSYPVNRTVLRCCMLATLFAIAGCAAVQRSTAPAAENTENPSLFDMQAPSDATRFSVIPEQSEIRILTFRDGPMARFGHNHVITTSTLSGSVWLAENVPESLVKISFPIDALVVDAPAARASEGEGFEKPVPENARLGTTENMRGEALLDASRHPFVRVRCGALASLQARSIECAIVLKDTEVSLSMPITISLKDNLLTASGEMSLSHTQLGLIPFSAAGGAVSVAEDMTIRYRFTAQKLSSAR